MKTTGVIYHPFQVATMPLGTHEKIEAICKTMTNLVFVLPVKRFPNSMDSPLDFKTRQMMLSTSFPDALVLPLPDEKYPQVFVEKIEQLVSSVVSMSPTPFHNRFYSSQEILDKYKGNGGGWMPYEFSLAQSSDRDVPINSPEFRLGALYSIRARFPISWMTVDMAILRRYFHRVQILLGMKPGEDKWRFPGGFKDRRDATVEDAVWREGTEEVIRSVIKKSPDQYFSKPRYLASRNIKDWRYEGDRDGITTLLYEMDFIGDEAEIGASDDLAQVKWFDLSTEVHDEMLVPEHAILWHLFMDEHR